MSANQLFSIPLRSELCVKCFAGPGQPNTSEGVTACIALASTGGVEGSFFTAQRCSPWLSRQSQGDSNVTGGAAAMQRKAIAAIVNFSRIISRPFISLCHCCVESKTGRIRRVKYWEIIADNLSKAGWSLGYVSAIDSKGRTIWIADAHRGDGKRFVVACDIRRPLQCRDKLIADLICLTVMHAYRQPH